MILLDNQQRNGKVGVQTYGVLVPDEAPDQRLLVDLGWLPMDGQRIWPAVSVPQGTVAVSGLRTNPPAVGIKLGDALSGASVTAKVVSQGRADKVRIIKFRRRKHHMKRQGHRQYYTEIEITGIAGGSK